jgi:transposase-like protein
MGRSRRGPVDRGGRPSKFTTATALAVVAGVARGLSRDEAARAAGVGPSTLYRWMARARSGDSRFAPLLDALAAARSKADFRALDRLFECIKF